MTTYVRDITNEEGNKLRRIVRHGREPIEVKRAQVILASAQGFSPPKIEQIVGYSVRYVRTLIKQFNENGFTMLKPNWNPGGNYKFTKDQKHALIELATSKPKDLGLPFQQWSLSRLQEEAISQGIVDDISLEWLRVILDEAEISHQRIKTWKESKDPEFEKKKKRIENLTHKKKNPPIVLSADEIGPISLKPHLGTGLFTKKHPDKVPANYRREKGICYEYFCLNVFHQELSVHQYFGKGGRIWLDFLKKERDKYPMNERIYIIQDNLSAHWTPDIRNWAKENKVSLVPTPTNASWLNPVECHAGDIQKLALDGSNYQNWDEVDIAFKMASGYRNSVRRKKGKTFRDTQDRRRKGRKPLWKRH
jgi:transposase